MFDNTSSPWFIKLARWIEKRGGAREIWRNENGENVLYLKRYYIAKTPWFEVFIHQFFRGDVGDIHDHPFFGFGRILQGGYFEHLITRIEASRNSWGNIYGYYPEGNRKVWRGASLFRWAWRPASTKKHIDNPRGFHKVELRPEDLGKGNVWTLFCTGPRINHSLESDSWGFLSGGLFIPYKQQMRREGTESMQSSHTQFKGWIFPVKVV